MRNDDRSQRRPDGSIAMTDRPLSSRRGSCCVSPDAEGARPRLSDGCWVATGRRSRAAAGKTRVPLPEPRRRHAERGRVRAPIALDAARGVPRGDGLDSRAARSGWGRRRFDARRQAGARGDRRRLLDGPDRGHQPPVRPVREGDRLCHRRRAQAGRQGLSRTRPPRSSSPARSSSRRRPARSRSTIRWCGGATFPGANWRHPEGPESYDRRQGRLSGRPGLLGRRRRLRPMGRQAAAHRGRVGVRRARRQGPDAIRLGRRIAARRQVAGQYLARALPRRRTRPRTASPGRPRSARSRPMASACTTWRATSGNGVPTGIGRATTSARRGTRQGPASSFDPDEPGVPKRVQRGGSFLCSDQYCTRYLPGRAGKGAVDSARLARRIPLRAVAQRTPAVTVAGRPGAGGSSRELNARAP